MRLPPRPQSHLWKSRSSPSLTCKPESQPGLRLPLNYLSSFRGRPEKNPKSSALFNLRSEFGFSRVSGVFLGYFSGFWGPKPIHDPEETRNQTRFFMSETGTHPLQNRPPGKFPKLLGNGRFLSPVGHSPVSPGSIISRSLLSFARNCHFTSHSPSAKPSAHPSLFPITAIYRVLPGFTGFFSGVSAYFSIIFESPLGPCRVGYRVLAGSLPGFEASSKWHGARAEAPSNYIFNFFCISDAIHFTSPVYSRMSIQAQAHGIQKPGVSCARAKAHSGSRELRGSAKEIT